MSRGLLAVLILLLAPSVGLAQANTLVVSQNKCDMAKLGDIRAFTDSAMVPIAQELVNEGKLVFYGSAYHAWGDEWNVIIYYGAESIPAFLSGFSELYARMVKKYPNAVRDFQSWCSEHKDTMYSNGKSTEPPPPRQE